MSQNNTLQFGLNLNIHRPMPSTDHNHILPFRFQAQRHPMGAPDHQPTHTEHPPGLRQRRRRDGVDHGVRQERLGGLGLRQVTEVRQHAADLRHEPHRRLGARGSGRDAEREERSARSMRSVMHWVQEGHGSIRP